MNESLRFICQHQLSAWKARIHPIPMASSAHSFGHPDAHKEGNYFIDNDGLKIAGSGSDHLRYCDAQGNRGSNPNGAIDDIAGICSENRRILGMMPHPERAANPAVTSQDGYKIIEAIEHYFESSL
jgi:phosphoribosylformylglycinamidine synthase